LLAFAELPLSLLFVCDVLHGAETAKKLAGSVEFQLGPLPDPFQLLAHDDAVFDVVASAFEGPLPASIDVLAVVGMDGGQEALIGQRRLRRNAENAKRLCGPGELVAVDVETPATGAGHGLRAVQVLAALSQSTLHFDACGHVFGEDQDPAYAPISRTPRPHLPFEPQQAPISALVRVLLFPHRLAGEAAAMHILPARRNLRGDLVVRAANDARFAKSMIGKPTSAGGEIAHLAIEHSNADRRLLDEQAKMFRVLPQGLDRLFIDVGWTCLAQPVLRHHCCLVAPSPPALDWRRSCGRSVFSGNDFAFM